MKDSITQLYKSLNSLSPMSQKIMYYGLQFAAGLGLWSVLLAVFWSMNTYQDHWLLFMSKSMADAAFLTASEVICAALMIDVRVKK